MADLLDAAQEVDGYCRRHGWRYCIIGGLALLRWGEQRMTKDVDVTLLTGFGDEERYVRALANDFEPLAEAITRELRAQFSPGERSLIARRITADPEAHELYQQARRLTEEMGVIGSPVQNDTILRLLERAVAKDPAFALGYAQLTKAHTRMYWFGGLDPTAERRMRAQRALETAERLAPGAPEVLLARGQFEYRCNNAWAQALVHYRAAEKDLPNDADLQGEIGAAHRRLGQWPEALVAFDRAAVLNPRDLGAIVTVGETLFCMRRYAQLEQFARRQLPAFTDPRARSQIETHLALARFALDDDALGYATTMRAAELRWEDYPIGYGVALEIGDLSAAEASLLAPGVGRVRGANNIIDDPVTLHRAALAWLRGDRDTARKLAEEALQYFERRTWNYRQEAVVAMGRARALALAGRTAEAAPLAESAVRLQAGRDSYALSDVELQAAFVHVVAGDREKAFAHFRRACSTPNDFSASQLRRNPHWTALRDDPRFEEILRTMKPL